MNTLASDGHWPDIAYGDNTRGAWKPATHLYRVLKLARAYRAPDTPLHGNKALSAPIHAALGYWLDKDYRCPNWWHNEIGVPRNIGSILILMSTEVTAQELEKSLTILDRAKIGMTGQNRVWLAGNVLIKGLLMDEVAMVREARNAINSEIRVSEKEGIQPDYSFHQHGPQLQLGNYGLSFADNATECMEVLRDTSLSLDPEKIQLLRDYVLSGLSRSVWKGMMDVNATGRQLFPGNCLAKATQVKTILSSLLRIDPAFAASYREALASCEDPQEAPRTGNTFFWRSDFMVDRRPHYYASMRMSSSRIIGTEEVNRENISGGFLGDGALYLYKSGHEYEDIFPVWDWRKLPGVTCLDDAWIVPRNKGNLCAFVGGVTDGVDGIAVLEYDRPGLLHGKDAPGLKAKKSGFFFENQIVCLGAGITSMAKGAVTTSVNQSLRNGIVKMDDGSEMIGERKQYEGLRHVWHDGTGYFFFEPVCATVSASEQTGSWKNVYDAGSNKALSIPIFSLWIHHGVGPQNASYAYALLPVVTETELQAYAQNPAAQILMNTDRLQLVRAGRVLGAVFYAPGTADCENGKTLQVDQPCVILIKESGAGDQIFVSDPAQTLSVLHLSWRGKLHEVKLPKGPAAGSSVEVK